MRLAKPNLFGPATLDDLFVRTYEWLMRWALHFEQGDRATAEDLVQDTFVRFAITDPELDNAENVEALLYTYLKHVHLAHLRGAHQRGSSISGRRAAQIEEPRRRENCDGAPRSTSPMPEKALFPNTTSPGQTSARVVRGLTKNRASAAAPARHRATLSRQGDC